MSSKNIALNLTEAEFKVLTYCVSDRAYSRDWYRTQKECNTLNRIIKKVIKSVETRANEKKLLKVLLWEDE